MSATLQPLKGTSPSNSPFPSSPAGSNFTPRKEFVQSPSRQSSFALLAFSSNNAIRLSNFPQPLVATLKSLLDSIVGLRSFRENAEHKLCEIVVVGKPWSNPKSLSTEIVLVQVFSVLLAHGYYFLSQLDYGREHNDRLSLAFSKPVSSSNPNPLSPRQPLLVPFGLSFPSPTVLRVVCSPLHATPAILQTVRSAWPRGVTSEKKLGEGCFEFKLKGYSWFQEDTFAEDALAHILTLLTALDKHSWTLLTSISLSSTRPRTKDLWLFSGPDPGAAPSTDMLGRPTSPVHLGSPLSPSTHEPIVDHVHEGSGDSEGSGSALADSDARGDAADATKLARSGSKRLSKLPKDREKDGHGRAVSDPSAAAAVLRKKAPPKRSFEEPLPGEEQPPQPRLTDHDIIPGPPPLPAQIIYSTRPPAAAETNTIAVTALPGLRFPSQENKHEHQKPPMPQTPMGPPPSHPLVSLPEPTAQHHADEDEDMHSTSSSARDDQTLHPPTLTPQSDFDPSTPPLLAPTAFRTRSHSPDDFRDSAFSDETGHSFDVPITWIPAREHGADDDGENEEAHVPLKRPPPSAFPSEFTERSSMSTSTGPLPPGGWASTPSMEVGDPIPNMPPTGGDTTPRQSVEAMPVTQNAVAPRSPHIVRPDLPEENASTGVMSTPRRKSEAGVLGVMPSPKQEDAPPVPALSQGQVNGHTKEDTSSSGVSKEEEGKPKEGWVLVSVASEKTSPSFPPPVVSSATVTADAVIPETGTTQTPLSSTQIIAAADAISNSPPHASARIPPSNSGSAAVAEKSALSRLFSRRKAAEGGIQKVKSADGELQGEAADKAKEKGSRFRRKTGGGVLPTIRSGKRINID